VSGYEAIDWLSCLEYGPCVEDSASSLIDTLEYFAISFLSTLSIIMEMTND